MVLADSSQKRYFKYVSRVIEYLCCAWYILLRFWRLILTSIRESKHTFAEWDSEASSILNLTRRLLPLKSNLTVMEHVQHAS